MIYQQSRKRPVLGDIIEVNTRNGFAYFQFINKEPIYGSLIRILPGFYSLRPDSFEEIAKLETRFYTYFPLGAAINRRIFEIVANQKIPDKDVELPLMRAAGSRDKGGKVVNWWLCRGNVDIKMIENLSPEQKKLSIVALLNDTLLVERIENDWKPENEY